MSLNDRPHSKRPINYYRHGHDILTLPKPRDIKLELKAAHRTINKENLIPPYGFMQSLYSTSRRHYFSKYRNRNELKQREQLLWIIQDKVEGRGVTTEELAERLLALIIVADALGFTGTRRYAFIYVRWLTWKGLPKQNADIITKKGKRWGHLRWRSWMFCHKLLSHRVHHPSSALETWRAEYQRGLNWSQGNKQPCIRYRFPKGWKDRFTYGFHPAYQRMMLWNGNKNREATWEERLAFEQKFGELPV